MSRDDKEHAIWYWRSPRVRSAVAHGSNLMASVNEFLSGWHNARATRKRLDGPGSRLAREALARIEELIFVSIGWWLVAPLLIIVLGIASILIGAMHPAWARWMLAILGGLLVGIGITALIIEY